MAPPAKSPLDDTSSPYYLHPSDGPGLQLVSTLLDDDNYVAWSRAMTISLTVKGKMGFINGKIPCPSDDDQQIAWQKNNGMVLSWILNSVSPMIRESVMFTDVAKDLWEDLRTRFSQSNRPRIFQLRQSLAKLKQDQSTVSVYYTRLKTIWDELTSHKPSCVCGACTCRAPDRLLDYHNEEYVMAFLMGLNDSLSHMRGQILLMDPLPSMSKIFALVAQEEKQKSLSISSEDHKESMVFAVKDDAKPPPQISQTNSSSNQGYKSKGKGYCTHCKLYGHTIDRCFKIHGYPQGWIHGWKQKKFTSSDGSNNKHPMNQVIDTSIASTTKATNESAPLSQEQCQQMLQFLSNQMAKQGNQESNQLACMTGHIHEDDWQG